MERERERVHCLTDGQGRPLISLKLNESEENARNDI